MRDGDSRVGVRLQLIAFRSLRLLKSPYRDDRSVAETMSTEASRERPDTLHCCCSRPSRLHPLWVGTIHSLSRAGHPSADIKTRLPGRCRSAIHRLGHLLSLTNGGSATSRLRPGRSNASLRLRSCADDPKKDSAKISLGFRRSHAHGLISKIPRTRRWRVTDYGHQAIGTSLYLREHHFTNVYSGAMH